MIAVLYTLLGAALIALDQWVKYSVSATLALGEAAPLLPGFVELRLVHNYGAAWSSFSGMRWLLVAVTSVIVAAVLFVLLRGVVRHNLGRLACTLIAAGGIGNIIDRVRLGYVVDMFNLQFMTPSGPFGAVPVSRTVTGRRAPLAPSSAPWSVYSLKSPHFGPAPQAGRLPFPHGPGAFPRRILRTTSPIPPPPLSGGDGNSTEGI